MKKSILGISIIIFCQIFSACNVPAQSNSKPKNKGEGGGKGKSKNLNLAQVPSKFPAIIVDDNGSKPAMLKGLHIATKWRHELDQKALNNPDVTSVTLYGWWMDMNPQKGVYDWSRLDGELTRFTNAGKNIGLMLAGGMRCPAWIFDEGVRHFTIVEFKHGGKGKEFSHEQPVVYDRAYIDNFNTFVKALAAHMKTMPYWNKLTHVSITGVNRTTAEFRLPAQSNMEVDGVTSTDATDLWKKNGYSATVVLKAFEEITNVVATAFPNRYLIIPIINNTASAFPDIDKVNIPTEGLKWLKQKYPNHAAAQYTALTPNFNGLGFVQTVREMGIPIGYELNESKNRLNEDEKFFKDGVQKGIDAKALYIEIFPENAIRFTQATTTLSPKINMQ
ncbi:MAG: beta-galactosidase [Bacteroidia bacterium]|nr:beta-galactosidase [Bacteroidia bacterium]